MAWQGFGSDRVSLCVCLSVADAPLSERVNPLILNQADVLAHHSLSSRPLLYGCLLLNLQASAECCSISIPVCFGLLLKLVLESCTPEKANTNTVDFIFVFLLCIYCLVKFIFLKLHNQYLLHSPPILEDNISCIILYCVCSWQEFETLIIHKWSPLSSLSKLNWNVLSIKQSPSHCSVGVSELDWKNNPAASYQSKPRKALKTFSYSCQIWGLASTSLVAQGCFLHRPGNDRLSSHFLFVTGLRLWTTKIICWTESWYTALREVSENKQVSFSKAFWRLNPLLFMQRFFMEQLLF